MSMGGVDKLGENPRNVRASRSSTFTSPVTTPFLLCQRTRGRVDECFACAVLALESHIFTFEC